MTKKEKQKQVTVDKMKNMDFVWLKICFKINLKQNGIAFYTHILVPGFSGCLQLFEI